MIGSLLATAVIIYLIYIFVNIIRMNKRRKNKLKEVAIVYYSILRGAVGEIELKEI